VKEAFRNNWQLFFVMVVTALLPTHTDLSSVILLWFVAWLYNGAYKQLRVTFWLVAIELFFLLHVLSIFYSENKSIAFDQVHGRLCFLLLPPLISTCSLQKKELRLVSLLFILSCAATSGFLLLRTFYYHFFEDTELYTYSKFSWFLHPSYLAMFMLWSLILFLYFGYTFHSKTRYNYGIKLFIVLLLIACILFCSSKVGLIGLAVAALFMGYHLFKRIKMNTYVVISGALVVVFGLIFVIEVPTPLERFIIAAESLKKPKPNIINIYGTCSGKLESTLLRILIWDASKQLMEENIFFGTGTGDAKEKLLKKYEENNVVAALQHKLNAHNQFVETQLGLGLAGTIPLAALTFGFLGFGIYRKDLLISTFGVLICMNLMVESMFEWRIACVFYAFFLFLLLTAKAKDEKTLEEE
jgi:O-antigen ligase